MADEEQGGHWRQWTALTHGAASDCCDVAAFNGLLARAVAEGDFTRLSGTGEALREASRRGDVPKVRAMLDAGANPNVITRVGSHALSSLPYHRSPEHLACLTAILDALPGGAVELKWLTLLVRQGADRGNRDAVAALARYGGERLRAKLNAELGAVVASIALGDGLAALERTDLGDVRAALGMAAALDELEVVKALVERGARAAAGSDRISFAVLLSMAAEGDAIRVIEWLLAKGADPDEAGFGDLSPLHRAVAHGAVLATDALIRSGASLECSEGNVISEATKATLPLVLAAGADIDTIDDCGECTLRRAVDSGDTSFVQYVLDQGATVDNRTTSDMTSLHRAVELEETGMVKLLLERGADTNIQDLDGYRALDYAHSKYMQQLIREAGGEGGPKCWS